MCIGLLLHRALPPPFPAADPPYLASHHLPLRIDSSQPNPILATKSLRHISRLLARYTPVAHSLLALQYCLCHTQKFDPCSLIFSPQSHRTNYFVSLRALPLGLTLHKAAVRLFFILLRLYCR